MTLQLITSVLFIPCIGYWVDVVGKRTKLLVTAASLGVVTYSLFILTYPTLPLILLGITYSLFATVIWPSLALVVKKEIIVKFPLFTGL
jgi:MFS family permease